MPPRVQKEYLVQVRDEDHLALLMNAHRQKLLVVDVYLDWCGPCSLLAPTYKAIAMKIDEWDQRIQFLQADVTRIKSLSQYQHSSKPHFLFFLVLHYAGLTVGSGGERRERPRHCNCRQPVRPITRGVVIWVAMILGRVGRWAGTKAIVLNLDWSVSREELQQFVGQVVRPMTVTVPKGTGNSNRGYGLVTFGREEDCDRAVEGLRNREFMGKKVVVKKVKDRREMLGEVFAESYKE